MYSYNLIYKQKVNNMDDKDTDLQSNDVKVN